MDPASFILVGLELRRFAPADDAAAALGENLDVIEAGGLSLDPYQGPALQPVLGWRNQRVALSLAPGLAVHAAQAQSADGREARVVTVQWRAEARGWLLAGPGLGGLDLAVSGGSARTGGATVAQAPLQVQLAPTGGVHLELLPALDLQLRARLPVSLSQGQLDLGVGGAVGLTWQGGGAANL